jgi:hypothetical protein
MGAGNVIGMIRHAFSDKLNVEVVTYNDNEATTFMDTLEGSNIDLSTHACASAAGWIIAFESQSPSV